MLTWAIAWVIVSGAGGWPLLLAGIMGDIVLVASVGSTLKRPPVTNTYNLTYAEGNVSDEMQENVRQLAEAIAKE